MTNLGMDYPTKWGRGYAARFARHVIQNYIMGPYVRYLSTLEVRGVENVNGERPYIFVANARALVTSIVRQGVFGAHRWSYWKFLATHPTPYRHCFGAAMTLAVMGYHFQIITRKLDSAHAPVL